MVIKATCWFQGRMLLGFAAQGVLVLPLLVALTGIGCAPEPSAWELGALDPDRRLILVDPGGRSRPLTPTGDIDDFSWAPDGRSVAYVCRLPGRDEKHEAHLLEVESGRDTVRPEFSAWDLSSLRWSPDGSRLAVDYGTACGGRTLLVVDARTGREEARLFYGISWAFSPDGQAVAFGRPEPEVLVPNVESGYSFSLALWRPGGGDSRTLIPGTSDRGYFPRCWPAEGQLVACVLDFSGGTPPRYLALDPASGAPPLELDGPPFRCDRDLQRSRIPPDLRETAGGIYSLSPDGRYLAFAAGEHPDTWVYVLDWERGKARRLVRGTSPQFRPRPSP